MNKPLPDLNNTSLLRKGSDFVGNRVRRGNTPSLLGARADNSYLSSLWWYVTNQSSGGDVDILAGEGMLIVSELSQVTTHGAFTGIPMKQNLISTSLKTDIVDGDCLYLKLQYTPEGMGDPQSEWNYYLRMMDPLGDTYVETYATEEADGHTHDIALSEGTSIDSTALLAPRMSTRVLEFEAATYEIYNEGDVSTEVPDDDRTAIYILIAEFDVTGSALTIRQKVLGVPIQVPAIIAPYGTAIGD